MPLPIGLPKINQDLLNQLRGLFHAKDRPIVLPNNGFIGLSSIDTPDALPPFPYRFIYVKADGCVYILDYEGNEYKIFSSDIAGNLFVDGDINITGEYQINGYNIADFISPYLSLPGLIGFWPMATIQRSTGNVPNYAPTYTGATKQDLVYNGNPTFNYTTTGVPYIDLDGTNDFLSLGDNTDLDIQGNESWAAVPGLTMGAWVRAQSNAPGEYKVIMGKTDDTVAPYMIYQSQDSYQVSTRVRDSTDTTNYTIAIAGGLADNVWKFIVSRYTPSTELKIWSNTTTNTNVTSIPAAILNGTDTFNIGAHAATNSRDWEGDITLCFLSANALSDAIIQSLFQQTRSLFGV